MRGASAYVLESSVSPFGSATLAHVRCAKVPWSKSCSREDGPGWAVSPASRSLFCRSPSGLTKDDSGSFVGLLGTKRWPPSPTLACSRAVDGVRQPADAAGSHLPARQTRGQAERPRQTTAPRAVGTVGRVGRLLSVMLPTPRRPTRPSGARELSVTDRSGERCQCDLRNNTEANGLFSPSCRSRARLRMLEDGKEPSHSPAVESGTGLETSVSL